MIRANRRPVRAAAALVMALVASLASGPATAEDTSPIGLEECIAIAKQNNPDIAIAGETFKKAESGLLASYGGLMPGFSLGFYTGHRYYGPSSVQFDASGRPVLQDGFDYEDFTFRMSSDIQLFDGGRTLHGIRASRAGRDAAREEFKYRRASIEAEVIRAYYNVVRYRMLQTVSGESADLAKRNLERTEALLEVGSATKADVLKARVRHSNTRLSVIEATNALEIAREELGALLRLESARSIEVDTALSFEFKTPDVSEEIRYAMTHRSDLKGYAHNIDAAGASVSAAWAGRMPSLGAVFSYNWNDRVMAENLNFFESEYAWSVTAYVTVDLFDRFLTTSNVRRAKADHRIAQHAYDKAKLTTEKQIRQLVLIMIQGKERFAVASETVEQAREDLRLAEERYRVGAGTMLETIDAQVALVQAKADVIQAECDYLIAEADLAVATGRNAGE